MSFSQCWNLIKCQEYGSCYLSRATVVYTSFQRFTMTYLECLNYRTCVDLVTPFRCAYFDGLATVSSRTTHVQFYFDVTHMAFTLRLFIWPSSDVQWCPYARVSVSPSVQAFVRLSQSFTLLSFTHWHSEATVCTRTLLCFYARQTKFECRDIRWVFIGVTQEKCNMPILITDIYMIHFYKIPAWLPATCHTYLPSVGF